MLAACPTCRGSTIDTAVYSAPFEATDLCALVPAVIGVGEVDPVADDARTYARRLSAAGNTVEYREFRAMAHGDFLQAGGA
jgi:acetyl esterase